LGAHALVEQGRGEDADAPQKFQTMGSLATSAIMKQNRLEGWALTMASLSWRGGIRALRKGPAAATPMATMARDAKGELLRRGRTIKPTEAAIMCETLQPRCRRRRLVWNRLSYGEGRGPSLRSTRRIWRSWRANLWDAVKARQAGLDERAATKKRARGSTDHGEEEFERCEKDRPRRRLWLRWRGARRR
jgi:hypothetical protein